MKTRLMQPCEHCGIDPQRILEARHAVASALLQVGGTRACIIAPTEEYERGALDALDWVLGVGHEEHFERHIEALKRLRDRLTVLAEAAD